MVAEMNLKMYLSRHCFKLLPCLAFYLWCVRLLDFHVSVNTGAHGSQRVLDPADQSYRKL